MSQDGLVALLQKRGITSIRKNDMQNWFGDQNTAPNDPSLSKVSALWRGLMDEGINVWWYMTGEGQPTDVEVKIPAALGRCLADPNSDASSPVVAAALRAFAHRYGVEPTEKAWRLAAEEFLKTERYLLTFLDPLARQRTEEAAAQIAHDAEFVPGRPSPDDPTVVSKEREDGKGHGGASRGTK